VMAHQPTCFTIIDVGLFGGSAGARPLPRRLLHDQSDRCRTCPTHRQHPELGLQTEQHTRRVGQHPKGSVDVASVMLVASLLDVVGDQQHVGATSTPAATTRPQPGGRTPLKIEEP